MVLLCLLKFWILEGIWLFFRKHLSLNHLKIDQPREKDESSNALCPVMGSSYTAPKSTETM